MKSALPLLFILLIFGFRPHAQERVTTFGLQVKPIIPSNLFKTGTQSTISEGVQFDAAQKVGYAFGMVIRHGYTKNLSLESGINYVHREYSLIGTSESLKKSDTTAFSIIGYEIPVTGLVFVKLSRQLYMDVAFGLNLAMFPSDVGSGDGYGIEQSSFRNRGHMPPGLAWLQSGLISNVGFEWRTEKSGYFYLGASYNRPFRPIYYSSMKYELANAETPVKLFLNGNYLTIDLRYFFHEPQQPRKVKE